MGRQIRFLVRKSGEIEECDNRIASWGCAHTKPSTLDSGPYETAHILDANEGTFYFFIYQNEDQKIEYQQIQASLSVYINDVLSGSYVQEDESNADDSSRSYFLKIVCDGQCHCTLERSSIPSCDIHADLSFPDDPGVYGYHND